jgi:hypothetical protein
MTQKVSPDPQYENGFPSFGASIAGGSLAGTAIAYPQGTAALDVAGSVFGVKYYDPADFAVSNRTLQVRIKITYFVGGVGPGTTVTWNFCTVNSWTTAGSNVRAGVHLVNAAITTTNVASPSANTQGHLESTAATWSGANYHCLTCVLTGNTAANCQVDWGGQLQYRHIQP